MRFCGLGTIAVLSTSRARLCLPRLCKSNWAYVSVYRRARAEGTSFRRIYLQLDEGTLRFNAGQVRISARSLSIDPCLFFRAYSISSTTDYWTIIAKRSVNLFIILANYEPQKNVNYSRHGKWRRIWVDKSLLSILIIDWVARCRLAVIFWNVWLSFNHMKINSYPMPYGNSSPNSMHPKKETNISPFWWKTSPNAFTNATKGSAYPQVRPVLSLRSMLTPGLPSRDDLRSLLFVDSSLRWLDFTSREEQNVQTGIHPEYPSSDQWNLERWISWPSVRQYLFDWTCCPFGHSCTLGKRMPQSKVLDRHTTKHDSRFSVCLRDFVFFFSDFIFFDTKEKPRACFGSFLFCK